MLKALKEILSANVVYSAKVASALVRGLGVAVGGNGPQELIAPQELWPPRRQTRFFQRSSQERASVWKPLSENADIVSYLLICSIVRLLLLFIKK